jgi:O-antigen/teichoic acid export membrane protein
MPLLTRLYDQAAFGVLAIFQSMLNIAHSVGVLGYHETIIIEKDEEKVKSLVRLCFILAFIMAVLVNAVLSIPLPYFLPYNGLKILLSAAIFFQLTNLIYTCWNVRTRHFKRNALYSVLQSVAIIVFQYVLFYGSSLNGMVIGLTLGYLAANMYMFINTRKVIIKRISRRDVLLVAKRYINFPKYFTFANFIESFSNNLPILFLTPLFSIQEIGLYGLAYKALAHGTSILSGNINHIIKSDMAAKRDTRRILPVYSKLMLLLVIIGGAISVIIGFFAPRIFSIVFGYEWEGSGYIAKMLIPLSFAFLLKGMGNATLRVFEKTKYMLCFSVISLALKLAALFIASKITQNFNYLILVYSLTACAVIICGELYLILCIKKHDDTILMKNEKPTN